MASEEQKEEEESQSSKDTEMKDKENEVSPAVISEPASEENVEMK